MPPASTRECFGAARRRWCDTEKGTIGAYAVWFYPGPSRRWRRAGSRRGPRRMEHGGPFTHRVKRSSPGLDTRCCAAGWHARPSPPAETGRCGRLTHLTACSRVRRPRRTPGRGARAHAANSGKCGSRTQTGTNSTSSVCRHARVRGRDVNGHEEHGDQARLGFGYFTTQKEGAFDGRMHCRALSTARGHKLPSIVLVGAPTICRRRPDGYIRRAWRASTSARGTGGGTARHRTHVRPPVLGAWDPGGITPSPACMEGGGATRVAVGSSASGMRLPTAARRTKASRFLHRPPAWVIRTRRQSVGNMHRCPDHHPAPAGMRAAFRVAHIHRESVSSSRRRRKGPADHLSMERTRTRVGTGWLTGSGGV